MRVMLHRETRETRETLDSWVPSARNLGVRLSPLDTSRLCGAVRRFGRRQCGAVAIETAIGMTVLVVALAVLMEVVGAVYSRDELARAARAAARALAIDSTADACAAVRRELNVGEDYDCLTMETYHEIAPEMLPATLDAPPVEGSGELVLVTIAWTGPPWSLSAFSQGGDGQNSGDIQGIVMGVARRE